MANKDFYDRIADALEVISGDDSHVDDVDKNMDYYKRIAEALENIAESGGGGSGGGSSGSEILVVKAISSQDGSTTTLDKTWQQIHDASICMMGDFVENDPYEGAKNWFPVACYWINHNPNTGKYVVIMETRGGTDLTFTADTPDDYPVFY